MDLANINWVRFLADMNYGKLQSYKEMLERFRHTHSLTLPMPSLAVPRLWTTEIQLNSSRHLSPKKKHEVQRLIPLVESVVDGSEEQRSQIFVDVGCGLGYLAEELLRRNKSARVLGIDCQLNLCEKASTRLQDRSLSDRCTFATLQIEATASCVDAFDGLLRATLESWELPLDLPVTVVSLHGCGDLQVALVWLAVHLPARVESSVTVACCYHKMERFTPMSKKFQNFQLPREALRLAANQPRARWLAKSEEERLAQSDTTWRRALLECVLDRFANGRCDKAIKQGIRKCVNSSRNVDEMSQNLGSVLGSFALESPCVGAADDEIVGAARDYLTDLSHSVRDVKDMIPELLDAQSMLQEQVEVAILSDRIEYLIESGRERVELLRVFDQTVSPRAFAIVIQRGVGVT